MVDPVSGGNPPKEPSESGGIKAPLLQKALEKNYPNDVATFNNALQDWQKNPNLDTESKLMSSYATLVNDVNELANELHQLDPDMSPKNVIEKGVHYLKSHGASPKEIGHFVASVVGYVQNRSPDSPWSQGGPSLPGSDVVSSLKDMQSNPEVVNDRLNSFVDEALRQL